MNPADEFSRMNYMVFHDKRENRVTLVVSGFPTDDDASDFAEWLSEMDFIQGNKPKVTIN